MNYLCAADLWRGPRAAHPERWRVRDTLSPHPHPCAPGSAVGHLWGQWQLPVAHSSGLHSRPDARTTGPYLHPWITSSPGMTLFGCVIPLELHCADKTAQNSSLGKASAELPLHFHRGNSENVKEVNARKILLLKTTTKDNGKSSESKCLFSRLTPDAVAVRSPLEAQSAEPNRARKEWPGVFRPGRQRPRSCCHTAWVRTIGTDRAKPGGPQLYNITSQALQKCNLSDREWEAEQLREFSVTLQKDLFPFDLPTDACHSQPHKTRIYEQVHPSAALPTASNHGTLSLKQWSKSFQRGSLLSLFMHQNQTTYKNCRIDESNSI